MSNLTYSLLTIVILLAVLIVLGKYFSNNKDAAKEIESSFYAIHDAIGVVSILLFFGLTIFLYLTEIQNIGPYLGAHLNMVNGEAILLAFASFSVIAVSTGAFRIHSVTKDGDISWTDWGVILSYFTLAIVAELIFYHFGKKVHVEYYLKNIEIYNGQLNNLEAAYLNYSPAEITKKGRELNEILKNLEIESWKGQERMTMLMYQIMFNLACIFMTTFGTAYKNVISPSLVKEPPTEPPVPPIAPTGGGAPFIVFTAVPFPD